MIIAVDFDGTCVTHEFPKVGKDIGAVPVLRALVSKGHKLILFTMRDSGKKSLNRVDTLQDAIQWFSGNGIQLWGINENPEQKFWNDSRKVYAHLYLDDAALGIPLKVSEISERPYVDWTKVEELLKERRIL